MNPFHNCLICGENLSDKRSNAQFCSATCRKRAERQRQKVTELVSLFQVVAKQRRVLTGIEVATLQVLYVELGTLLRVIRDIEGVTVSARTVTEKRHGQAAE